MTGVSVDRILEVLDGGLQRSSEPSYGTDFDQSKCVRCRHHPHAVDGDLCPGCRVFLLGDSDHDPKTGRPVGVVPLLRVGPFEPAERVRMHIEFDASGFVAAMEDFGVAMSTAGQRMTQRITEATRVLDHIPVCADGTRIHNFAEADQQVCPSCGWAPFIEASP